MRLGQFARKYDIRVQDLISYLEKEDNAQEPLHSNTKLSEEEETEILDFFGIEAEEEKEVIEIPEIVETKEEDVVKEEKLTKDEKAEKKITEVKEEKIVEDEDAWIEQDEPVIVKAASSEKPKEEKVVEDAKPAPPIPSTPEEDIALAEGELDFMPTHDERVSESIEDVNEDSAIEVIPRQQPDLEEQRKKAAALLEPVKKPAPKEDEIIDTDRLMELLESEEEVPDLDKIKLIKAAKKELSGLKVVGKVELPEPKKKEISEEAESDKEVAPNKRNDRPKISEEEREKRRIKSKQKREEFEAREKRRIKEKEEKEKRDRNASHYKQKLSQPKAKKQKHKPKKAATHTPAVSAAVPVQKKAKTKKEQPTSVLGKMWKWLTNPD